MATAESAKLEPVELKLEVVMLGVADVDRAKAFYQKLGWRLDADFSQGNDYRVLQLTPPHSPAAIIFGKGLASPKPGSVTGLILAVDDVDAARDDLIARGVAVSEVFHFAGGPFSSLENSRVAGATRKVNPTARLPRLKIRTATAGCCRRSRRGAPAANGSRHERSTSPPSPSSCARRESTTAPMRRRTPTITGGTGTHPT